DGIRDFHVTGVQTCALPIYAPVHRVGDRALGVVDEAQARHLGHQALHDLARAVVALAVDDDDLEGVEALAGADDRPDRAGYELGLVAHGHHDAHAAFHGPPSPRPCAAVTWLTTARNFPFGPRGIAARRLTSTATSPRRCLSPVAMARSCSSPKP